VIHDSEYIRNKYSRPIYGKNHEITSLNFDEHTWIQEEKDFDPYKTLPNVFEEYNEEKLDSLVQDMEQIAQGGAAMTAYAKLQFSHVPENQREQIKQALLKYCELDTMAMVMIWDYWRKELGV
jgi:sulfite reductase beta subunit-like hemoprotein